MIDEYDQAVEDGLKTFQDLVALYLAGRITIAVLRGQFREALRLHFTRLMILALNGSDPTVAQLAELNRRIDAQYLLLEAFLADLAVGAMSPKRALWRAGMYAPSRGTYVNFTLPQAVATAMQGRVGLPGDICLGDGLCGCSLDISFDLEGNATVYWVVDPIKEHCEVCLNAAAGNPYYFTVEELIG